MARTASSAHGHLARCFGRDSLQREGDGTNAWAFAPSRTGSGCAILVRNPQLDWNAGYYEAYVTAPGILDFFGDFRLGNPWLLVAGLNPHRGVATKNDDTDNEAIHALDVLLLRVDHYLFDGASHAHERF